MLPRFVFRLGFLLFVLLFPASSLASIPTSTQEPPASEAMVEGRLGGKLQAFVARFGEPNTYIPALGPVYAVDGFGLFVVYVEGYGNEPDPDRARRLNRINISSPRPLDLSDLEPDAMDWTISQAIERVLSLLPVDVALSEFGPRKEGQASALCQSAALDEIFAGRTLMQCRVLLIMPTPTTVSYAILTLIPMSGASADEMFKGAPCAGVVAWINAAGNQLAKSQDLLAEMDAIDEADPTAAASLRDLATSFYGLAADQRGRNSPDVTAQANFYLVSALTAYAKALDTAADGVEQHDSALIDTAIETFDEARRQIRQMAGEIEQVREACALILGTPVPAGSPISSAERERA